MIGNFSNDRRTFMFMCMFMHDVNLFCCFEHNMKTSHVDFLSFLSICFPNKRIKWNEEWIGRMHEGKPVTHDSLWSDIILELLEEIQMGRCDIIPKEVDVRDAYGVFRSFRRGATTAARNARVSAADISLNNGWRAVEASRGKHMKKSLNESITRTCPALHGME